ncbi:hypothetical protein [Rufibacter aurantiacus]|uniref:hypothetical protein n=1 Tax=Rufibacter aurantiacus TaxID=2817374 RepID=UPI001B314C89|nr:hypothetical protein [Rufibacter aurantiacus]
MAYTLTIKDETFPGKVLHQMELALQNELVTVKDIIEARVTKEVEEYNQKLPQYFSGLVQPTDTELTINGYKLKERKKIDPEKQVFVALNAFQNNGYFVLVDNKQAESLEEEVLLTGNTTVSFLKLTPLVGG